MTTDSALPELRRRLADAGFDERAPRLEVLWPVLREWAAVPVDGMDPAEDADMLLFECSLELDEPDRYAPHRPCFTVGFTRQFSFEDEHGEYDGMAHLTVDLVYEPHEDFRQITTLASWSQTFGTADQFWGGGAQHAAAWAERVEQTRSYQAALRHQPKGVTLDYGPV